MKLFDYSKEPTYSMDDFMKDIWFFNSKRNDFEYNEELEEEMLKEEFEEFKNAETLADLIDAIIDFEYVLIGSDFKLYRNIDFYEVNKVEPYSDRYRKHFQAMIDTALVHIKKEDIYKITAYARQIVAYCNNLKTDEKLANGKIKKSKDVPNATKEITIMIEELGYKNIKL